MFQIGFVVPDLEAAMAFFKTLGVPEFLVWKGMLLSEMNYRGQQVTLCNDIAFGYMGEMQIELIHPVEGESTFTEFLARNPAGGMQHIGLRVPDYDAAAATFQAQGFSVVQSGRHGNTRFGYFDTDSKTGAFTEVVYIDPEDWKLFDTIRPH